MRMFLGADLTKGIFIILKIDYIATKVSQGFVRYILLGRKNQEGFCDITLRCRYQKKIFSNNLEPLWSF